MQFQPGDVQLISNHTVVHARTAYTDVPGASGICCACGSPWIVRLALERGEAARRALRRRRHADRDGAAGRRGLRRARARARRVPPGRAPRRRLSRASSRRRRRWCSRTRLRSGSQSSSEAGGAASCARPSSRPTAPRASAISTPSSRTSTRTTRAQRPGARGPAHARRCCACAQRGAATGVVSNFDGRLPGILAGLGLAELLGVVMLPGEARAAKPDPRIFALALARLGVPPRGRRLRRERPRPRPRGRARGGALRDRRDGPCYPRRLSRRCWPERRRIPHERPRRAPRCPALLPRALRPRRPRPRLRPRRRARAQRRPRRGLRRGHHAGLRRARRRHREERRPPPRAGRRRARRGRARSRATPTPTTSRSRACGWPPPPRAPSPSSRAPAARSPCGAALRRAISTRSRRRPPTSPVGRKVELLGEIDVYARGLDPRVKQVMASVVSQHRQVLIAASDGTLCADVQPLVRLNVQVVAADGALREVGYQGMGGRYPLERLLRPRRLAPAGRRSRAHRDLEPARRALPRRHAGRGARPGLAGRAAARGGRPRPRGRLQPQADLRVLGPDRRARGGARASP